MRRTRGSRRRASLAQARQRPDAVALRVDDDVYTYGELSDAARDLAHALHGLGVRRGDRVGVLVPELGRVLLRHPRVRPARGDRRAGEHPLQGRRGGLGGHRLRRDRGRRHPRPPARARAGARRRRGSWSTTAGRPACPRSTRPRSIGDGWPTTMAYTSGTTGRPKGVAMGPDDMRRRAAGVAANRDVWGIGPDTVHLMVGPAYHAGPSYWAQMHLAIGATVVVMRRWDAETALALIERWQRHHESHGAGELPAHPRAARRRARPATTSRRCSSSCTRRRRVPVPLKRAFMEYVGADKVWEYYGASEGGGTVISPAGVARRSRAASASRSPATGSSCSTTTATSSRPARSARCGSRPRARASSTTTTPRRRRRSTAASSSPSATPRTSTRTATCSSPTGSPTW